MGCSSSAPRPGPGPRRSAKRGRRTHRRTNGPTIARESGDHWPDPRPSSQSYFVDDTGEEPSRLPSRGLPDAAIDVLPTFRPTRPQECQVCMEDDISLDLWRRLPCMHAFHCHCADAWLRNHNTCPACAGVVVLEEEDAALERSLLA